MTAHSGWRAGAITAPLNDQLQKHISELEDRFPIVRQHRKALSELGSQMVHAQKCTVSGLHNCRISLVRFSGAIESAFGLTREVMFFYSPYPDLQIRELKAAKDAIRKLHRDVTPDVVFVWSPDPRARQKLDDWSSGGFLAIPLSSVVATDPVSLVALLRDYIYARDLFYESTPVRGDRFFGRRQLMQALRDDVQNQRVAGLFGLRKAGKTSVLTQLADDVRNDNRLVVLRDLESLPSPPTDPIPSLIKDLKADLVEVLRRRGIKTGALSQLSDEADASDFRRAMQTVLRSLSREDITLVLLLDEIEYLTPSDRIDISEGDMTSVSQFLGALRSLVQENENFTFVLSGLTSAIVENGRLFGRPNPLFSWAKTHLLAPFDRAEADELATSVGGRMGINIDEAALATFFEATGGHAFLYRSLASSVVQQLPVDVFQRRISRADVLLNLDDWKRTVAGNINEMVSHVRRYYPLEAVMLDLLMESPTDFGDIAKDQPLELQHLLSLGLVEKDAASYQSATILSLL